MSLTPEQRATLLQLRSQLRDMRDGLKQIGKGLEIAELHEESRWLAVGERLGREAADGDPITAADEERAKTITRGWLSSDLSGHEPS